MNPLQVLNILVILRFAFYIWCWQLLHNVHWQYSIKPSSAILTEWTSFDQEFGIDCGHLDTVTREIYKHQDVIFPVREAESIKKCFFYDIFRQSFTFCPSHNTSIARPWSPWGPCCTGRRCRGTGSAASHHSHSSTWALAWFTIHNIISLKTSTHHTNSFFNSSGFID